MRLPGTTTYEEWDAMRRERFTVIDNMEDVKVMHNDYETCLFMFDSGISGIATWCVGTGSCSIVTKREAIFSVIKGMRNYMLNALDAWEFEPLGDRHPQYDGQTSKNIDSDLPWGVLFRADEVKTAVTPPPVEVTPPPVEDTPACPDCGENDNWVIDRDLSENMTWNPETRQLESRNTECTELDIFCGYCGYDANYEDDSKVFDLLESAPESDCPAAANELAIEVALDGIRTAIEDDQTGGGSVFSAGYWSASAHFCDQMLNAYPESKHRERLIYVCSACETLYERENSDS